MSFRAVTNRIREFRDLRDWKQFHNPKDMAVAISIESSELLEHFLWKSPVEVDRCVSDKRAEISDELADNLEIDLAQAMEAKIAKNALKYPVDKAKGSNKKYTELEQS